MSLLCLLILLLEGRAATEGDDWVFADLVNSKDNKLLLFHKTTFNDFNLIIPETVYIIHNLIKIPLQIRDISHVI